MINKPVAGQSEWKSCHIYKGGQVRCVGSGSDDREEIDSWTKAEQTIIHKACALICAKVGGFEESDQAKVLVALDADLAERKIAVVEEAPVVESIK